MSSKEPDYWQEQLAYARKLSQAVGNKEPERPFIIRPTPRDPIAAALREHLAREIQLAETAGMMSEVWEESD